MAYSIATRIGAEAETRFLGGFAASNLISKAVAGEDRLRTAELVATNRDVPLCTVDASVVAAAERLRLNRIATLDRRHFTAVRPLIFLPSSRSRSGMENGSNEAAIIRAAPNRSSPEL